MALELLARSAAARCRLGPRGGRPCRRCVPPRLPGFLSSFMSATSRSVTRCRVVNVVPSNVKLTMESSSPCSSRARMSASWRDTHRGQADARSVDVRPLDSTGSRSSRNASRIGRASSCTECSSGAERRRWPMRRRGCPTAPARHPSAAPSGRPAPRSRARFGRSHESRGSFQTDRSIERQQFGWARL